MLMLDENQTRIIYLGENRSERVVPFTDRNELLQEISAEVGATEIRQSEFFPCCYRLTDEKKVLLAAISFNKNVGINSKVSR